MLLRLRRAGVTYPASTKVSSFALFVLEGRARETWNNARKIDSPLCIADAGWVGVVFYVCCAIFFTLLWLYTQPYQIEYRKSRLTVGESDAL